MNLVLSQRLAGRSGLVLALIIAGAQFVPYGRDLSNPLTTSEPTWDSPETRALAKRACFDCHSNETEWPAYSRIAPVSWLIQYDVEEGRAALNFSDWDSSQRHATEAAEEIIEREMPPAMYRLMHSHARLTDAERDRLARGLDRSLGVLRPTGTR